MKIELPELPQPVELDEEALGDGRCFGYTASMMRAYARAALEAAVGDTVRDAERFAWLSENCRPWESDYERPHALIRICRGPFQNGIGWFNIIGRQPRLGVISLREAVDAALLAAANGEGE